MQPTANRLLRLLMCALIAVVVSVSGRAEATTMVYADVDRLTEISDLVVHGVITDQRVFIGDFGNISTEWTVHVSETWKGEEYDVIRFSQFGGEMDGNVLYIPGDARFEIGEEVVLFLHGEGPDQLFLSAMGQSKYEVDRLEPELDLDNPIGGGGIIQIDPTTMREVPHVLLTDPEDALVQRDLTGISFYAPEDEATQDHGGIMHIETLEVLTLSEIRDAVLNAVVNGEGE